MLALRAPGCLLGLTLFLILVDAAPVVHRRSKQRSQSECRPNSTTSSQSSFTVITSTSLTTTPISSFSATVFSTTLSLSTGISTTLSSYSTPTSQTLSRVQSSTSSGLSSTTLSSSPLPTSLSTSRVQSITSSALPSTALSSSSTSSLQTTSHSQSTTSSSLPTSTPSTKGPIVAAYWSDWASDIVSPEQMDFDRFDWVDYAFALPDASFDLTFTEDNSVDLLQRLVTQAHSKEKRVKLSIGGWTGSAYFSTAVSSAANRQTFAQNILSAYNQFNLDGIDIDWEYPSIAGASPSNGASPDDSANFLLFLQLLRQTLPPGAVLSAAAQVWPWAGPDGNPMTDVSAFAKVLNWVTLMNYDIWGSSSTPGSNAPLSDGCHNSSQPLANAVAAVNSWTSAKFPASQLVLGVPSYGYVSQSTATRLTDRNIVHERAKVELTSDSGSTTSGQILFRELISGGALRNKNGSWVGTNGFHHEWDDCSSTPFLVSSSASQVITYDDPDSLGLKAAFALQAGLLGVNMFDASGDTAQWVLADSLREGLAII